jgi:hypothetical protein
MRKVLLTRDSNAVGVVLKKGGDVMFRVELVIVRLLRTYVSLLSFVSG